MWCLSWVRNRQNRPARRLARYRPRVQVLEGRCLPSTVTNLNDAGPGSLRDAIATTPSGGTVDFQEGLTGTIVLMTGELAITKLLTIAGPGADVLTVSGNHASRVFNIGATFTVDISGMTIADSGVSNAAGGGILNSGALTVTNSNLRGNRATSGGGIYNEGTLTVTGSTLSGNNGFAGGGIANAGSGTVIVTNSTLSGNSQGGGAGGAIYNAGTLTVTGSTLSGNSASAGGGIVNSGTLTVTNSTLSGNIAGFDGGGIITSSQGTVTLTSSTISGNTANGHMFGDGGGGIFNNYGRLHTSNTIIAGNSSSATGPDLFGDLGSEGYNLIGNNQEGSGFVASDLVGTPFAPIDPLLGPLQDNGGLTQTMALLAGSPALNAGDPGQLGVPDQRGVVRTVGVNIGAYQASATAFVLTAPDTVTAGTPFDVTVQAVDPFGQLALGYTGTVTFSTSDPDPGVMLPDAYTFTADDQGTHTFSGGFTLITPGDQTLTATDTADNTIIGGATVTVTDSGGGLAPTGSPSSRGAALDRGANLRSLDRFFTRSEEGPSCWDWRIVEAWRKTFSEWGRL